MSELISKWNLAATHWFFHFQVNKMKFITIDILHKVKIVLIFVCQVHHSRQLRYAISSKNTTATATAIEIGKHYFSRASSFQCSSWGKLLSLIINQKFIIYYFVCWLHYYIANSNGNFNVILKKLIRWTRASAVKIARLKLENYEINHLVSDDT